MNAQLHATHMTAMKSGVLFSASRSALAAGSHVGADGNAGADVDVAGPSVAVAVVADDDDEDIVKEGWGWLVCERG